MRYLVTTAARDEGPFLLEWIAWYTMLGFSDLIIATNQCNDASPEMLDRLEDAGWLTHLRHAPPPGVPPLQSAHRAVRHHRAIASADWVFVCDVDELLVIRRGSGMITDLLPQAAPPFVGMALHWRCFGTGGVARFVDLPVHRQCRFRAPPKAPINAKFKSIFRTPLHFRHFGSHAPSGYIGQSAPWVTAAGKPLRQFHPNTNAQRATATDKIAHGIAHVNHYALRSTEHTMLKRGTPSASLGHDRYTDAYFAKFDRNDQPDNSTDTYADRFSGQMARLRAVPGILRLHHLCCAHYVARLANKAGYRPEDDPRYIRHLKAADFARITDSEKTLAIPISKPRHGLAI